MNNREQAQMKMIGSVCVFLTDNSEIDACLLIKPNFINIPQTLSQRQFQ